MILITGAPRSGTSLTAAVLRACGAGLGAVDARNEHPEVIRRVVKPYLMRIGADPRCQDPLPEIDRVAPQPGWRARVLRIMGLGDPFDGTGRGAPAAPPTPAESLSAPAAPPTPAESLSAPAAPPTPALKCPKACLIWPVWTAAFPEARWVIVRRGSHAILASVRRTPFMRGLATEAARERWLDAHLARLAEIRERTGAVEVWAHDGVTDPEAFRPAVEHAGLAWDPDAAAACIDPARWSG